MDLQLLDRPPLELPYPPGLSGYLTERGTLFTMRTSEESFLRRFPFKGGIVLEANCNGKVLWEGRRPGPPVGLGPS